MYLLPWRLADALSRDALSERAKSAYLFAFLIWPFPLMRIQVSMENWPVAAALALILFVGWISVFRANGGGRGQRLVERYVCLHTPVAISAWIVGGVVGGILMSAMTSEGVPLDDAAIRRVNALGLMPWFLIVVTYFAGMQYYVRRAARPARAVPA